MIGRRKGFTLIELLVVIAIILVLAAILFPIFASAQKAAQKSACANNMKQLFIGIQNYASDNNDKTPMIMPKATFDPTTPGGQCWPGLILKYIKTEKLFVCSAVTPTLLNTGAFPPSNKTPRPEDGTLRTTYGMNMRFSLGGAKCTTLDAFANDDTLIGQVQSLSSPPQPSKTVLLIESQHSMAWKGSGPAPSYWPSTEGGQGNYCLWGDWNDSTNPGVFGNTSVRWNDFPVSPFGHTGGCHVVCADGHVKFIKAPAANAADWNVSSTAAKPGYCATAPSGKAGLTWWDQIN